MSEDTIETLLAEVEKEKTKYPASNALLFRISKFLLEREQDRDKSDSAPDPQREVAKHFFTCPNCKGHNYSAMGGGFVRCHGSGNTTYKCKWQGQWPIPEAKSATVEISRGLAERLLVLSLFANFPDIIDPLRTALDAKPPIPIACDICESQPCRCVKVPLGLAVTLSHIAKTWHWDETTKQINRVLAKQPQTTEG